MVTRRQALTTIAAVPLAASATRVTYAAGDVYFGVSGPFSGDNANYGRVWRMAMNMAVDEINAAGGLQGRKLNLVYQDTQSDPKQSVAVAQQFVDDQKIIGELGDFASPASMAASPIYERAHMVQFGFTNSDPNFTKGGQYMWSTAVTMQQDAAYVARTARPYGKKQAIIYRATDWGKTSHDVYAATAEKLGAQIVASENYLENEKDYRSILLKVRSANPDVVAMFAYYTDGALLLQQARDVGLSPKFTATAGSCYNAQFLKLGGDAVNGVIMPVVFFVSDPRPEVQTFVSEYRRRYKEDPDQYAARAYDATKIMAWAAQRGNFTRTGIRDALAAGKGIPSILFGPCEFGPDRRVKNVRESFITVKDGKFAYWRA